MLLPSPEATEELPMNPFRAVRHPPRRPQHFQQNAFHEGKGWVSMLPRHSIVQSRASVPAWAVIDKCADLPQMCCWGDCLYRCIIFVKANMYSRILLC